MRIGIFYTSQIFFQHSYYTEIKTKLHNLFYNAVDSSKENTTGGCNQRCKRHSKGQSI